MEFRVIGVIPDDECIVKFDLMNIPLDLLPEDSPSIAAVTKMLNKKGFCIQERTNHE
jgi:CO dehydrogenase nickel-insertion accessory protein CooC1